METKTELKSKVNNRQIFNRWQQTAHQMNAHVAPFLLEPAFYSIKSNNHYLLNLEYSGLLLLLRYILRLLN